MRRTAFVLSLALVALVAAACSSAASPGWTYFPETPAPPASAAPSASAPAASEPAGTTAPSEAPGGGENPGGEVLTLTAMNIQWMEKELSAPADTSFTIRLVNQDAGIPHNVEIKSTNGQTIYKGDIFNGVETRDFVIDPLPAGTYQYICTVHPNMVGTLTVGG